MILPRLAIAEVARSDGTEARRPGLIAAPLLVVSTFMSIDIMSRAHTSGLRATGGMLLGLNALQAVRLVRGIPVERWRPLYSWLERP